jgi:hypothetical protein
MATSSFGKVFEVSSRSALLNLKKACEAAPERYVPKYNVRKKIEKGIKKLNQIQSR